MMDYPLGKIYAFDFDGTLTTRDTLIEFIRYVKGTKGLLKCMGRYLPLLVAMKMGLYPNWKAKQKVFAYCFRGMPLEQFDDYCQKFARDKVHLMRSEGMKKIDELLAGSRMFSRYALAVSGSKIPFSLKSSKPSASRTTAATSTAVSPASAPSRCWTIFRRIS